MDGRKAMHKHRCAKKLGYRALRTQPNIPMHATLFLPVQQGRGSLPSLTSKTSSWQKSWVIIWERKLSENCSNKSPLWHLVMHNTSWNCSLKGTYCLICSYICLRVCLLDQWSVVIVIVWNSVWALRKMSLIHQVPTVAQQTLSFAFHMKN